MNKVIFVASLLSVFCGAEGMQVFRNIDVAQNAGIKCVVCKKRSKFTEEEDRMLSDLVKEFGSHAWKIVADQMPGKTARQVRERWHNYLAPGIDHSPFSKEDDILLLQKTKELGKKWAVIVSYFRGRTSVMLKNRYCTLMLRKSALEKKQKCNFTFEQFIEIDSRKYQKNGQNDTKNQEEIDAIILKYFNSSSDFDMCLKWPGLD